MNKSDIKAIGIKIRDLARNITSLPISIQDLIFNQNEIEFVFPDTNEVLPYSDFLYFQNQYMVTVIVMGESNDD